MTTIEDVRRVVHEMDLYQVVVIHMTELEKLYQFLTKEQAEKLFIKEAKSWYNEDGLEEFVGDDGQYDIEILEEYYGSEPYLDNEDLAHVFMEPMNI